VSLNGNLEDLPLLDILQIVSFSKKTGFLAIQAEPGEGAIVFQEGFVVASFTWDSLPVDPRAATLPEAKRAGLIRERIAMALEQLIRLREGQFSFSLTDEIPGTIANRDIRGETLHAGINPQELLLDLARGIDEDRRDSSAALEASFAQPMEEDLLPELAPEDSADDVVADFVKGAQVSPAPEEDEPPFDHTMPLPALEDVPEAVERPRPPEPASPPPPEPPPPTGPPARTILLVDDEQDVRGVLAGLFRMVGYEVVEADEPSAAVREAQKLGKAAKDFFLITDLGMPTSGGSSFQGGFEVVKRLGKMNMTPPVLMMTENLSPSLQARARQLGISSFVFKPSLSKLDSKQFEADLRAFASKLVQDVLPRLGRPETSRRKAKRPADAASVPPKAPVKPPSIEDLSRDFSMLQQRLDELRTHGDATQISVLVMRVAREFFERGILFLVKNDEVRGLGGFGPAPKDQSIGLLARDIVVSLGEPSVFRDVVAERRPFVGPPPEGKWSRYLVGKIGRFQASELALMPLLTHRETIAVLFGDNPETGRPLGRLDGLEVFINQAGVALENAFLQRKVQTLEGSPE
jgi:CheY-like chemotaxis protein